MGAKQMTQPDETVVCESCDRVVRPIDRYGDEFYTCPFCQSSLQQEIDRHEFRHRQSGEYDEYFECRGGN